MLDYRLAPQNVYPAALEDAVKAYKGLLQMGYKPDNIILMGDSAGGNLSLALAVYLRDNKIPQPKAIVLLSPWTYLGTNLPAHTNNLEITNNKLKKENREKEIEIYHLKEESILMEKNIRDLEIKVNTQSQEASAARSEAFKKEEEIESLKTIIHEKNKNLISMERQFAGMADLNEQTNNKLLNLTIENNILNNRVEK